MKKVLLLGIIITSVLSCSLDNSTEEEFFFEILPIESVTIPNEMTFGEVYTINYTYFKPLSCYFFHDLYYITENNIRTIDVINKVLEVSKNTICDPLINILKKGSFDFIVNQNGEHIYLVHEVTIV